MFEIRKLFPNRGIYSPRYIPIVIFIIQTVCQNVLCESMCNSTETTCSKCINTHPSCAWCSQEEFSKEFPSRCDTLDNLIGKCDSDSIVSPVETLQLVTDLNLSDKGAKENEAIQLKPQEIKIQLRKNSVHKFKLEFRQAVDYPVDLYYLMDLSNSMADDKMKLAELGNKLAAEMETITKNFRLGFGSFVDKTVAPFVNSHPDKLEVPCPQCAAPYGFLNNMPLSNKTREFAQKVRQAPVSGNLDAPEGGFDALMQAIVCKEEIGWRNKARKLLVFSTDNSFHYAGDGKLGGVVTPNDEKCHLNGKGYYTMSAELDYPSLSQLHRQIREHKVNVIFAVTRDQVNLYETLSQRLSGFTGKLENDSSNVVDLVRQLYNKITSSVQIANDAGDNNIQISYYSTCLGGTKEKTNICTGLKVGTNVTFEVHLDFTFCPKDRNEWNKTFHIYPVGLQEYLTVNLEMLCECDCEKPWNEEVESPKCSSGNGTFECGICSCNQGRYGKECECDKNVVDSFSAADSCFKDENATICSGQGTCKCGVCDCEDPQRRAKEAYGKFCECNDYSCDKKDGKICSGPENGVCECGSCRCSNGWTGDDCSCRNSVDSCMGSNGKICSGHGTCECGSCVCSNAEQDYFGTYCDDCSSCPGMCDELRECVECSISEQKGLTFNCSACEKVTQVSLMDSLEISKDKEKGCTFEDEERCQFSFKYSVGEKRQLFVWVRLKKECPEPVNLVAIVAGVISGVVVTGFFLLMLFKILTVVHDRRELAKFEKERLMAKWNQGTNPLYKEVETTYQNPAYGGAGRSELADPLQPDLDDRLITRFFL